MYSQFLKSIISSAKRRSSECTGAKIVETDILRHDFEAIQRLPGVYNLNDHEYYAHSGSTFRFAPLHTKCKNGNIDVILVQLKYIEDSEVLRVLQCLERGQPIPVNFPYSPTEFVKHWNGVILYVDIK